MSENKAPEIKIFILSKNPDSFSSARSYLLPKNYQPIVIESFTEISERLKNELPTCAIISSDYPNEKITLLPDAIMQGFKVPVIGVSETGTVSSLKTLSEMNIKYKIQPPIAGPAIDRIVQKIILDSKTTSAALLLANKEPTQPGTDGKHLSSLFMAQTRK